MSQMGRMLIVAGLVIAIVGVVMIVAERLGLGRLPGDLIWKRKHTTVYLPLLTSLLVSVVLSVLVNLFLRRK
jgi:hypothetical protein